MRSAEDAQYYRRMEVVVNRVMMRLMECVLKERPESSKHVLVTISDVIKQNLKASDKIWLCGACAAMNETEAVVCHSCRLGKNEPIPPQEAGDGPLLVALRHDLARREESLALREHLIAVRERDLGVDTSPMPVAKVKAKSATDVPSRFGDGADLLPSQEKVPEKPVLFPKGYVPLPQASSADGKGVLKFMAVWADPQGKRMWSQETIDDFVADSDFLVDVSRKQGKSGNEAAMIVRTLYAYTHSQLGPRVLWAVWVPEMEAEGAENKRPPKWEPLFKTSTSLEEQYQKHRSAHNETNMTNPSFALETVDELAALLMVSEQDLGGSVMIEEHKHLANIDLSVLFGVCSMGKLVIVRYENIYRGDLTFSPLRDNVLWIPSGEILRVSSPLNDDPSCSETPYPGVFEYIASNVPSLALRSSPDPQSCSWTCTPFADDELKSLIEECLAEPNQQKPNKAFHERALELLERGEVTRQCEFPNITRELFAGVFKASCRFDDAVLLTPEEIARSFTMQCVTWYGRHYLLTLSTTTVETRTPHTIGCIETGNVSRVYRVVTSFWPQQIFYLLNMAMRETQFGNPDALLTIDTSDDKAMLGTAGQYYATQPATWEDGNDVQPAVFSRRDKGLFGTAHLVRLSWCGTEWRIRYPTGVQKSLRESEARVALKAWMLPQVRPFIFFMNKALDAVQESDDVHATRKTYRGISCSLSRDVYDTGRVLVWAQYSSTSEDQGVAAAFAKGESAAAVFTMHGATCVPVKPFSRFAREAELLYKNNTCFRVTEALTKEQAQILGKDNLQLFTLEEVSETAMHCLLVRRLLPLAKTTAAASVVFQAEAALKGNKCLELSLSHNKVGEVPSKWQVFFHEPTVGCPIEGSSAWNNPMCDEKWLDVFEQACSSMTPVSEDEQPQHLLYASEAPDGRPGAHGVTTIKVSGGIAAEGQATGLYQNDDGLIFYPINEGVGEIRWEDGKWVFQFALVSDKEVILESEYLLGEWPKMGEFAPPTVKAVHADSSNLLAPRCSSDHVMTVANVEAAEAHSCAICDKEIKTKKYYTCMKCTDKLDLHCVNSVSFDEATFALERNTLVKYVNDEVDCPRISSLKYIANTLVDQNGFETETDDELAKIGRLAAMALIPHNIPLQQEQCEPSRKVLEAARHLVGRRVDRLRIFGKRGTEDRIHMQLAGYPSEEDSNKPATPFWCVAAEFRKTHARPGLAVGNEGAFMASRVVRLNVPLEVVGLRNNLVGIEGAKELLEAVRRNPHVREATLGDDHVDDAEVELYRVALSIRCMYHSCMLEEKPLLADHLSGIGARWPEILALGLGDIKDLELPVGGILDHHPVGWAEMARGFVTPPRPAKRSLHHACEAGQMRAVIPLLDDCGMDPDELDEKGAPPLLKAVRQNAFECEQGRIVIVRLVTPETMKRNEALKIAARVCGPVVTGELLKQGMTVEDDNSEVLLMAMKNPAFGKDLTVLGQLLQPQAISNTTSLLYLAAKAGQSFEVLDALLRAGVDPADCESEGTALHVLAGRKDAGEYAASELAVIKKMATHEALTAVNDEDDIVLMTAIQHNPSLAFFLCNECDAKKHANMSSVLDKACTNSYFNSPETVGRLKELFGDEKASTALHAACRAGLVHVTQLLLDEGFGREQDPDGNTPLHSACMSSSFDWAKSAEGTRLIDALAKDDLNAMNGEEEPPLVSAIAAGLVETTGYILKLGASVQTSYARISAYLTRTSAFESCERGREIIRDIVMREKALKCNQDTYSDGSYEQGMSSLMVACTMGKVETARIFLDLGMSKAGALQGLSVCSAFAEHLDLVERIIDDAELAKLEVDDAHPVIAAIAAGNGSIIPVIMKHMSDEQKTKICEVAIAQILDTDSMNSHEGVEILQLFLSPERVNERVDGNLPLYYAITRGFAVLATALLDLGADPSILEDEDTSCLLEACITTFNKADIRDLIRRIAVPSVLNSPGYPLYAAIDEGQVEIAEVLLSIPGIDITKNESNKTIAHAAASRPEWNSVHGVSIFKRVLDRVPQLLGVKQSGGKTPFHYAAEHEHWYLLEAFISYGMERPWVVDTERRCVLVDNNQRSPLHELAGSLMSPGFETKVFRKLAVAPLIDMQDDQGDTALHEAARHRPITAQLLIDCGASLTIVNNARRTPLHECCESNFSVELCKAMLCGGADLDARDADDKTAYDLCIDSMDVDANDDAASAVAAKDFAFLAPSSAASD